MFVFVCVCLILSWSVLGQAGAMCLLFTPVVVPGMAYILLCVQVPFTPDIEPEIMKWHALLCVRVWFTPAAIPEMVGGQSISFTPVLPRMACVCLLRDWGVGGADVLYLSFTPAVPGMASTSFFLLSVTATVLPEMAYTSVSVFPDVC